MSEILVHSRMLARSQVLLAISLLLLGGWWRRAQTKQKNLSWDDTIAALQESDWGLEDISERYLYRGGLNVGPNNIWEKIQGKRGLLAMYRNAPLLVHLADCAAECSNGPDEEVLVDLRRDAFQIRLSVLLGLFGCAIRSTEMSSLNSHRAVMLYSEMLARLTALIQESAGQLLPSYLGAM